MPKAKTEQEYKNEIVKFNVELLEPYKNNHTALRHRCLSCGNEWMITPHNILSGHDCPKCSHKKSKEEMEMLKNNFLNSLSEQKRQTIELMEEFNISSKGTLSFIINKSFLLREDQVIRQVS